MMNTRLGLAVATALLLASGTGGAAVRPASSDAARRPAPCAATPFVENAGQWGADVAFAVSGGDASIAFGRRSMTLAAHGAAVEYGFVGARDAMPRGEAPARAKHHYFHGRATAVHARTFSSVVYDAAWPGVDLRFDARPSGVEYTLLVRPGADATAARIRVRGAARVEATAAGALDVTSSAGTVTHSRPVAWQDGAAGREPVDVAFEVGAREDDGSWTYGFALGEHDRSRGVVVDPFFHVDGFTPAGARLQAIALGPSGDVYAAGWSSSPDAVPSNRGSFDTTLAGKRDAWVGRIDQGGALVWATFLGGGPAEDTSGSDEATGIGVAGDGSVVITGFASGDAFPLVGGPELGAEFRPALRNTWVARLSSDGAALIHSGLLGGYEPRVAVGPDGAGYVAWIPGTQPAISPETSLAPAAGGGRVVTWVARLSREGAVLYLTELRGVSPTTWNSPAWDLHGLAVDAAGAVHLSGTAREDAALPAAQVTNAYRGGSYDAFVMKLDPSGTALEHALFVGGDRDDYGGGLVLDSDGAEHLVGQTTSSLASFPRAVGPETSTSATAPGTAFVARIPAAAADDVTAVALGSTETFSDYVLEMYFGIAIDLLDRVYATADGLMWRLDPDGTIEAYAGDNHRGTPATRQPGVLWFGRLWLGREQLNRYAEESLGSPDRVEAVGFRTDSVRVSWIPREDPATEFIVERATEDGPFSDAATVPGDTTILLDAGGLAPDTLYRYRVRSVTGGVESLRSEVAGARTDGTLRLSVTRRRATDRERSGHDVAGVRGSYRPREARVVEFDPSADAVRVTVGSSFFVNVPAGDAGWSRVGGADVWRGAAFGGTVKLRIDSARGTFSVTASGMDLPRPRPEMPAVSLRLGGDAGSVAVRRRRGGR